MQQACFDAFHAKVLVTLNNTLPFAPKSYNIFKITCTTYCQTQNYLSTTPFLSVEALNPYKYLTSLLLCTCLLNIIMNSWPTPARMPGTSKSLLRSLPTTSTFRFFFGSTVPSSSYQQHLQCFILSLFHALRVSTLQRIMPRR